MIFAKTFILVLISIVILHAVDGVNFQPLKNIPDSTNINGQDLSEMQKDRGAYSPNLFPNKINSIGKFHVAEGTAATIFSGLGILGGILTLANGKSNSALITSGIISLTASSITLTFGIIEIRLGLLLQK